MLLNSPGFNRLQSAIGAAEMRQRVISNNVANDDTPKFKRSDVTFEQLLDQTMGNGVPVLAGKRTNSRHIPIGSASSTPAAKIVTDENSVMNNNSNNVDIDREMSLLAENQLTYNFYVQQLNHDFKMMRTAIEGR